MVEKEMMLTAKIIRSGGRGESKHSGTQFAISVDEKGKKPMYLHYNDENGTTKNVGLAVAKRVEFIFEKKKVDPSRQMSITEVANYLKRKLQELVDNPEVLDTT